MVFARFFGGEFRQGLPVPLNNDPGTGRSVTMLQNGIRREGNLRWALVGLLLGLPIPIVLLLYLFMGH